MGRLKCLEVENFKSYEGTQLVGPFYNFTCVIGPNGAGKSNMMDAISFVLGVQSKHLRSSHLKELVYRKDAESKPARKATVKLVYSLSENELEGRNEGADIVFSRSVSSAGVSSYRLDGKEVTYEAYETLLRKIGVLVKARNFLVFQGDVESVAAKSPAELTKLIEQISGSEEYSAQYEELRRTRDQAEENTIFSMQKKKMYMTQCREVKGQKEEAEAFLREKEELANAKTEHTLWQIFRIKLGMEEHQGEVENYRGELDYIKSKEQELEDEMLKGKREVARVSKLLATADKEVAARSKLLDTVTPKLMETRAKLKGLQKRLAGLDKSDANVKKDLQDQKDTIAGLSSERDALQQNEATLQKQSEKATAADSSLKLDKKKLEEYSRLREEVAARTAAERADELTVDLEQKSKQQQLQRAEDQQKALIREMEANEQLLQQYTDRLQKLNEGMKDGKTEMGTLSKAKEKAASDMKKSELHVRDITTELETINEKLRSAKDDRRRSKQEERISDAIDTMSSIFKGVHGKLVDLCRPIQKKYSQAVSVSAGKHMDAIVVDSKHVATECIRYLKDQRVGTCLFLPLDNLTPKGVPERLRTFGSKYRPCIDLVECDERFKPAVAYALESTLVCETLEDAQDLCFTRNEKVKVVTVRGHVIGKSGAMTGGAPSGSGRSDRWEEKEVEKIRKKKAELTEQLETVNQNTPSRQHLVDLETKLRGLQNRVQFSEADAKLTKEKLEHFQQLKKLKEEAGVQLAKEKADLTGDIKRIETRLSELRGEITEVEEEVFLDFSRSVGVDNIREYEDNSLKKHQDLLARFNLVSKQVASLTAQLEYEQQKDFTGMMDRLAVQVAEATVQQEALESAEQSILQKELQVRATLKECTAKVATLRAERDELMKYVKQGMSRRSEIVGDTGSLSKKVAGEEIAIERARAQLHDALQKALVDEVALPTVGDRGAHTPEAGSQKGSKSGKGSTKAAARKEAEDEEDDADESDDDNALLWTGNQSQSSGGRKSGGKGKGDESISTDSRESSDKSRESSDKSESAAAFSQSENAVVKRDSRRAARVDLSSLKKFKNMSKPKMLDKERDLLKAVQELTASLETVQPNMHAVERYDGVVDKLNDCNDDLENTKRIAQDLVTDFEETKKLRQQKFQECYSHVSEALGVIYKDLTRSSKHPLGGNAYLTLDNTDEPYLGGIRFTAMPPMKRFRDMDQLSGGEKTMAALALLFSIHSYRQAPFFVLDEVDAALDNVNVKKICNYIKQRSVDFQCIVISLKDMFFEHSDGLVGICKDVETLSSKILTLDLGQYEESNVSDPSRRSREEEEVDENEQDPDPAASPASDAVSSDSERSARFLGKRKSPEKRKQRGSSSLLDSRRSNAILEVDEEEEE